MDSVGKLPCYDKNNNPPDVLISEINYHLLLFIFL